MHRIRTVLALTAALLVPRPAVADPPTTAKAIPADGVIRQPGAYFLQHDLIVERGIGIKIEADNVTLDLSGHALRFEGKREPGTFGVLVSGQSHLRISNGCIGAFWFGIHCTQTHSLHIDNLRFNDISYVAVNVAQSKDVLICESTFTDFGYAVPKPEKDHYLVGINIGADDAIITRNRFEARYSDDNSRKMDVETVFVLLSADVSQGCVVAHNQMAATRLLDRSYGIWVAAGAQASVINNTITNMTYGVCLEVGASVQASSNRFIVDPIGELGPPLETHGIYARTAKKAVVTDNQFIGVTTPVTLPKRVTPR